MKLRVNVVLNDVDKEAKEELIKTLEYVIFSLKMAHITDKIEWEKQFSGHFGDHVGIINYEE